ncbi:right-handed parallel beta-helix repeat-containing protein [Subtercola sp. RTI3]|uniref:beta strand repeat-containing protein n=1 Tax=Subtercola sp. RTI3 TaxID=3048639 RepID=UPI002B225314|nr:right-handed parallel beta-helix repeat-containing protein [Subtercola sp. RTI3]MEA9985653.1 right-handed parallel beta-helix repeat-containing protein [Subtercola sp. RTI3]
MSDSVIKVEQPAETIVVTETETQIISVGIQGPPGAEHDLVTSVAGRIGNVVLSKTDVGLESVDDTSDVAKPVSAATQAALNTKANTSSLATVATTGNYADLSGKPTIPSVPVQSVAGRTGNVVLAKSDVGLSSVDNTSDVAKPISTATQTAINLKANTAALATVATTGSYTDLSNTPTIPTIPVTSVAGRTGAITLTKTDVGLASVDNTADINKPVSSAQATSIATKEPSIAAGTASQYFRGDKTFQTLDKTVVGLPNVDNTADVNKPISTATQTALNAKASTSALAAVATSGSYTDLVNTPTIPVTSVAGRTGAITLTKSDVGLGNVDNTADLAKPISTSAQAALNLKVNSSSLSTVATTGTYSDLLAKPSIRRVFNVTDYGAVANVILVSDALTTASSPIVTSSSATFTVADVGKLVTLQQGSTLAVQATNVLTINGSNLGDGNSVTIGLTTYRFKITMAQAFDVQIAATASLTLSNLYSAINGSGTAGTNYYSGTVTNTDVVASALTTTTLSLTALALGATGNQVQTIRNAVPLTFAKSYMGGGLNGVPLKATIVSVQSTSQVTLSSAVTQALSQTTMIYGTDAAAGIGAAISAAVSSNGGTVYLPEGNFIISTALTFAANVFIKGSGIDTTRVFSNVSYDYMFRKRGTTSFANFGMSDLTLDTNNVDHGSAIRVEYASQGSFERIRMVNTGPGGWQAVVGVTSTSDSQLRNFDIKFRDCIFDCITSTLEQLLFLNASRVSVKSCKFLNQTISNGPGIGFYQNVNLASVDDCDFVNCVGPAIYYSLSTNYVSITNSRFAGPGTGIQGANLADNGSFGFGTVRGLKIVNCSFSGCGDGLQLGAAVAPLVMGCNFDFNILTGIRINRGNQGVSALSTRFAILANTFNHNNVDSTNSLIHPAILFELLGGQVNGEIAHNAFWNDESNRDQQYAITFSGAFLWDAINIHNNYMPNFNSNQNPVGLSGGATIGPNVVVRNSFAVNPQGFYLQGSITGAVTFDRLNGDTIAATLTGNITGALAAGRSNGDLLTLMLTQDSAGSRAATWSNAVFAQGGLILSTNPNSVDVVSLQWTGTSWQEVSRALSTAPTSNPLTSTSTQTSSFTAIGGVAYQIDATSGAVAVTLPTSLGYVAQIGIKKLDTSANVVTIGGKINGTSASSIALPISGSGKVLIADGSGGWNTFSGDESLVQLDARYVHTGGAVTSAFGRTGAVVAASGDYTASMVGSLASTTDLSAIATANPVASNVPLNAKKITGLASGTAATDAATFGQVPTTASSLGGLMISNNLSDLASLATSQANLGLGTIALLNSISLTANVTGILPVANGGTGSSTQNFIDLTTTQSAIAGNKGFSGVVSLSTYTTTGTLLVSTVGGDTRNAINIGNGGFYFGQNNGVPTFRSGFSGKTLAFRNSGDTSTTASVALDTGYASFGGSASATSSLQTLGSFASNVLIVTAATTLDVTYFTLLSNSSSPLTHTLPTAVGITGRIYSIKNINTGIVTIATTSSQTIEGATTFLLSAQYAFAIVQSDGANWQIISSGYKSVTQQSATTDLGVVLSNSGNRAAGTAFPITTSGAVSFGYMMLSGGFKPHRTTVSNVAYTALNSDYRIAYTALTAPRIVTLFTAVGNTGAELVIVDETGNAATSNITITPASGEMINGSTSSKVISTAYGFYKIYSNGTGWIVN